MIVNVLLPIWLQTLALTLLLVFVIYKTANKGLKQWRSESKDVKMRGQTIMHEDQLSPDSEGALCLTGLDCLTNRCNDSQEAL